MARYAEKKEKVLEETKKQIDSLCSEIAGIEQRLNDTLDVRINKEFGQWVQNFLLYAAAHEDDRSLQNLRDSLIVLLANMHIQVYDEVQLNEKGKPDVPKQGYLIDSRKGDEYTRVVKPAVYSDKSILVRGEIQ